MIDPELDAAELLDNLGVGARDEALRRFAYYIASHNYYEANRWLSVAFAVERERTWRTGDEW